MERKMERVILRMAATWNIVCGLLTIFGYSTWFKEVGNRLLQSRSQLDYGNTSYLDTITKIIMIYGLFVLFIGVANWLVAKAIKDNEVDKKIMTWLVCCTVFHFLCLDWLGMAFYTITTVFYIAKNKAILANQPLIHENIT